MIDPRSTRAYKLEKENKRLIELCNKYEEEHKTAFKLWTMKMEEIPTYKEKIEMQNEIERLNNIIDGMEKYCNEEIEDYDKAINSKILSEIGRDKYEAEKMCFTDMLDKLQELKGSSSNE